MIDYKKTLFKYDGVFWLVNENKLKFSVDDSISWKVDGPYCPNCREEMETTSGGKLFKYECENENCGKKYEEKETHWERNRTIIKRKFEAKLKEGFPVIALDLPIGKVGARDEDENYWVEANMGQHNGKKTAVVYLGDKTKPEGKTQIFIDLEDEQVRFHSADTHPADVACKVIVEFPDSKTTIEKK